MAEIVPAPLRKSEGIRYVEGMGKFEVKPIPIPCVIADMKASRARKSSEGKRSADLGHGVGKKKLA